MSEENKHPGEAEQPPGKNEGLSTTTPSAVKKTIPPPEKVLPEQKQGGITSSNQIEIPATQQSQTPNSKQQTQPMEVHHHTHPGHHKKKWTDYFWEFLMLFLAVFCGFLAEYQLEHVIESSKEKEYIASMITDAGNDKAALAKSLIHNQKAAAGLDSLASLCYDFDNTEEKVRLLYYLFANYAASFESARFTDRTRSQLKNSGNMRLIRSKASADSITLYDNRISDVLTQEGAYSEFMKDEIKAAQHLFNFKHFQQTSSQWENASGSVVQLSVLTKNPEDFIQFGNKIFILRGIMLNYIRQLKQMEARAENLIKMLKKEYHLE